MTNAGQLVWQNVASLHEVQHSIHATHRTHSGNEVIQKFPLQSHKTDKGYVLSLSKTAQNYLESEQERSISQVTSQLNMATKIVSNSATSDSQRLATISSAYHLFFMGSTLGAISGNFASAWGRFKAANSDSDFNKYFAIEKQFVPSISPVVESTSQKNRTDMTGYAFNNRKSSSSEGEGFEQKNSAEGNNRDDVVKEIGHSDERESVFLSFGHDSLFSLMMLDEIIAPREKQGRARLLTAKGKKEVVSLKT